MPATLSQSPDAAMPDAKGGVGLRAELTPGLGGAQLEHPFAPGDTAYARVLFAPQTLATGSVQVMGLDAGAGDSGAWLVYDADGAEVTLHTAQGAGPAAALPAALAWHSLELTVDAALGSAALRVNGMLVGEAAGLSLTPVSRAWLGAVHQQAETAGVCDFDDWVMSPDPIGPLRVAPSHDHAGDPARWLVVYNRDVTDAAAWAEHYRAKRSVPYTNLCGLSLPAQEVISMPGYQALRDAVEAYLDDNGLSPQVMGVLLGMGVPGYVDTAGQGDLTPVMSLFTTPASNDVVSVNPLHRLEAGARISAEGLMGVRLTGRIDGADLAEASALTDRAIALADEPIRVGAGGTLWYDPVPEGGGVNPVFSQPMLDWADSASRQSLRLDFELADDAAFSAVHDDAFFWGWGQAAPPTGFFASPAGRRALCIQLESADPPAASQRDPQASHWLRAAVDAGYAAAAASSRPYTLSALPQPAPFFGALRGGWTLAEAWLIAQPFIRSGMQLIGDPLMTPALPKAGFDVFGPAASAEQIDLASPIARLPADARSDALDPAVLPAEDGLTTYLVRRIDDQGRSDAGSALVRRLLIGGEAHAVPPLPAWPHTQGWRIAARDGAAHIPGLWASAPSADGAAVIVLEARWPDDSVTTVYSAAPEPGRRRWLVEAGLDALPRRYRWRVVRGAVSLATPWSLPVSLGTPVPRPLVFLETS